MVFPTSEAHVMKLNSDILFCLMIQCPTLTDLRCLMLAHPTFHVTFDSRRRVILRRVFENDLRTRAESRLSHLIVKAATPTVNRSKTGNKVNHLALLEGAWAVLQRYFPGDDAVQWASTLLQAYKRTPGHAYLGAEFAFGTWKSLKRPSAKKHFTRTASLFVLSVARTLKDAGRANDALEVLGKSLEHTAPQSPEFIACIKQLAETHREAGDSDAAFTVLQSNWESAVSKFGVGSDRALELARLVLAEYNLDNREAEALAFQLRVKGMLDPTTAEYVAWCRRLIRVYQREKRYSEALGITEEVWRHLNPVRPGYRAWTADLYRLHEALGRRDAAVAVWESAWETLNRHLVASQSSKNVRYHVRGAGASLAAAYVKAGREDLAVGIRERCKELED